jgi:hypothetical protein
MKNTLFTMQLRKRKNPSSSPFPAPLIKRRRSTFDDEKTTSPPPSARLELLRARGVTVPAIAPLFRRFVFPAYLADARARPTQGLLETVRLARQTLLIQAYVPRFAWKPCVWAWMQGRDEKWFRSGWPANPLSLMRSRFARRDLALDILRIVGGGVVPFLSAKDLASLYDACPEADFAVQIREKPRGIDMVVRAIMYEAGKRDPSMLVDGKHLIEIPEDFFSFELFIRAEKYPDHPLVGISAMATHVMDVISLTEAQRKSKIEDALAAHGLELRQRCFFCQSYIAGDSFGMLDEVVARCAINAHLASRGNQSWQEHRYWETRLLANVITEKIPWMESFERLYKMSSNSRTSN